MSARQTSVLFAGFAFGVLANYFANLIKRGRCIRLANHEHCACLAGKHECVEPITVEVLGTELHGLIASDELLDELSKVIDKLKVAKRSAR